MNRINNNGWNEELTQQCTRVALIKDYDDGRRDNSNNIYIKRGGEWRVLLFFYKIKMQ